MEKYSRRIRSVATALCSIGLGLVAGAAIGAADDGSAKPAVKVDNNSFKCMLDMTHVRHFYVDNLAGKLDQTVAVAKAGKGDYPEGSVVQLMPNEVMLKQQKGFSAATRDWEFLWIDVDKHGSKIFRRGAAEVENRFGLNCFACHVKAKAEFDLICEKDHGCDPIPVTRMMFTALQKSDPRCKNVPQLSADEREALVNLGEVVKSLKKGGEVKTEPGDKSVDKKPSGGAAK